MHQWEGVPREVKGHVKRGIGPAQPITAYLVVIVIASTHDYKSSPENLLLGFIDQHFDPPFLFVGPPIHREHFVMELDMFVDTMPGCDCTQIVENQGCTCDCSVCSHQ
jgi:hypothetical protein